MLSFTTFQIEMSHSKQKELFEFKNFYKDFSKHIYDYLSKKLYGNSLSVGSGWAYLEYHLSKKFKITATDVNSKYAKNNYKINYIIKDFISDIEKVNIKYDNIYAPGIIYLFNQKELGIFLENIKKHLNQNGNFYLFFRSRDSYFINFIDNYLLPLEILIKYLIESFKKKKKIIKNLHGYRRNSYELEKILIKNKFDIISKKEMMHKAEYNRSKLLRITGLAYMLSLLKLHPYITVYHLKKSL